MFSLIFAFVMLGVCCFYTHSAVNTKNATSAAMAVWMFGLFILNVAFFIVNVT